MAEHEPSQSGRVSQRGKASGHGRVTLVGRDQHVHHHHGDGSAPRVPMTLPAASAHLVGRTDETAGLLELLAPRRPETRAVVVSAVHGLGGVGKTALVLDAAHQAVGRGWFAGGAVFVALRGYDPAGPVTAAQAMDVLLRALGVRDEDLPPGYEERAGLYQSELARRADQDAPVLVVADDVASAEQVRPLIPAQDVHRLLVTSRDALGSLPARLVSLDELRPGPAAGMIGGILTLARAGDTRPADQSAALDQVVERCGRLPLALRIAAAILVDDPGLPIASLAADLADERTRLDRLHHEEAGGRSTAVRAAFELSYRRLNPAQQLIFRLLSLNLGPDIATDAVAALAACPAADARPLLAALARAGLVAESPAGSGRWRRHDLIAVYAAELAERQDADRLDQARSRLLDHYSTMADAAADDFQALPRDPPSGRFTDREDALAWLDAERPNLVAAVARATTAHPRAAIVLARSLAPYLARRRHLDDAIATGELALTAARRLGDQKGEAATLHNLGNVLEAARRFPEAIDAFTHALAIRRQTEDRRGEGHALTALGGAYQGVRRFEEAIDAHGRAITLFQESGDRRGAGMASANLGSALASVRRFDEAIDALTRAVTIFREIGDQYNAGLALNNLGSVLARERRFREAIKAYFRAGAIYQDAGDQHGEAGVLSNLGSLLKDIDRFDEAIEALTRAVTGYRETGDRYREGIAWDNLGSALKGADRLDEAIDAHTRAIALYRETGDRHGEAIACNNLGRALRVEGRFEEAVDVLTHAVALYRETRDRHGEGGALHNLGDALGDGGEVGKAIDSYTKAALVFNEIGDRHGEGAALINLSGALRQAERSDEAIDVTTRAAALYREAGTPFLVAGALHNRGNLLDEEDRLDEAADAYTQAAAIFGEIGDRDAEQRSLTHLSRVQREARRRGARNGWRGALDRLRRLR
ncbi:AfsR-like transcriptional regulator TcrA [Actinoallomurus vinaceus]|uniref:AfsR-like transcriptional regulator TcrA n=1 Tax=Actinoallomurus vinaceus TaxID=1080074 RepID=A0ABP8U6F7_9ACTN